MTETNKIVIAGEGGQGVQAIGDILAEAAVMDGKEAIYIPNFGIEQRGGVSLAFVQIGNRQIGSPKFRHGNIVIALSERAIERTKQYITEKTIFIYDSSLIAAPEVEDETVGLQAYDTVAPEGLAHSVSEQPKKSKASLPQKTKHIIGIPASDIARKELLPRVFNMIILGAAVRTAGIVSIENIKRSIESKLGKKFVDNPKLRELNYSAIQKGIELIEEALKKREDGNE